MLSEKIYTIDFKRLVIWLLPPPQRKPVAIAWLMALINPAVRLYNNLLAFRKAVLYRIIITPQICYLEKALNDKYDTVARRIRIKDAPEYLPFPLYRKVESKKTALYKKSEAKGKVLYTKAETTRFGADFIVEVPVNVLFDLAELTAFINGFKLATKKFKVRIV